MKGNKAAYAPVAADKEIREVKDVFRRDPETEIEDNPLVMTSIRLHARTRTAAKVYAAEHGMKLQEVIENALRDYIGVK